MPIYNSPTCNGSKSLHFSVSMWSPKTGSRPMEGSSGKRQEREEQLAVGYHRALHRITDPFTDSQDPS
jgi:hypothetical protein